MGWEALHAIDLINDGILDTGGDVDHGSAISKNVS